MRTNQNGRRDFLCKSGIFIGLLPLSKLEILENHFLSSKLQFSLIDGHLSSPFAQQENDKPSISKLRFSTGKLIADADNSEMISKLNLNTVLYGMHLKAYSQDRPETFIKSTNLPLVNSITNLDTINSGKYVQPYLIHYSGSKKVGIMGLGINEDKQSFYN